MNAVGVSATFVRQFLREPVNVLVLALVPGVLVVGSSDALASFAETLGSEHAAHGHVALLAAGWGAGIASALAAHYLVIRSLAADRFLALGSGGRGWVVPGARIASLAFVVVVATAVSAVALWGWNDVGVEAHTVMAILLFACTYGGLGVVVGGLVRDDLAGSLAITGLWMFDALLGPSMGNTALAFKLVAPTNAASAVLLAPELTFGLDLALAIGWGALAVTAGYLSLSGRLPALIAGAGAALTAVVDRGPTGARPAPAEQAWRRPGPYRGEIGEVLRACWREIRRNRLYQVLLVVTPAVFVGSSFFMFTDVRVGVPALIDGVETTLTTSMPDLHGAYMGYIASSSLAGLSGLFIVLAAREADARLVVSGARRSSVVGARLLAISAAAVVAALAALVATLPGFQPRLLTGFVVALVVGALTWGAVGAAVGAIAGRLGGALTMFALPFLDVGIAQDLMLGPDLPEWGRVLPSYGSVQVLIDASFSTAFHSWGESLLMVGWLVGAFGIAAVAVHTSARRPL